MIDTDVTHALCLSWRRDRRDGPRVGFDTFTVTGHLVRGDTVYLTLTLTGWIRELPPAEAAPEPVAREDPHA